MNFRSDLARRLRGLAASHDILVLQDWQGAPLADLVRDQLAPFVETARIEVSGPDILISPRAAERIAVSWEFENQGTVTQDLRLSWIERGGPVITPPSHKGFGYRVFERFVTNALNGKMTMDFPPEGLNWNLVVPTANLMAERTDTGISSAKKRRDQPPPAPPPVTDFPCRVISARPLSFPRPSAPECASRCWRDRRDRHNRGRPSRHCLTGSRPCSGPCHRP